MKIKIVLAAILAVLLLALPACDNGDDNGGGASTGGYSNASLTGNWGTMTRRIKPGTSGWFGGTTIFDAAGQVSAARSDGLCPGGDVGLKVVSSALSVSADGRITGEATVKCPTAFPVFLTYQFDDVYFIDANTIKGTLTLIQKGVVIDTVKVEMKFTRR